YMFIAVVPIALIVLLASLSGYILIGQVEAYFVRTDLSNREGQVLRLAEQATGNFGRSFGGPAQGPGGLPPQAGRSAGAVTPPATPPTPGAPAASASAPAQTRRSVPGGGRGFGPGGGGGFGGFGRSGGRGFIALAPGAPGSSESAFFFDRQGNMAQARFPGTEVLIKTTKELRFPDNAKIQSPPSSWPSTASGLVYQGEGENRRFYIWAHLVPTSGEAREVTILTPLTSEVLASLDPQHRLTNVAILDATGPDYIPAAPGTQPPPPLNWFDLNVRGEFPLQIPSWDNPDEQIHALLAVNSRLSAVLGIIFEQRPGQQLEGGSLQDFLIGVALLFLFVEIASLWTGIRLSRSMTGAVHEIYQGTQRVKEGDFSYRIPVRGNDQLAEMGASFNTMTENLSQLIVVAKEKERLQSELEIAREVQNQLFPRDVPSSKSLELKGICNPARVVSGDYYDFMNLDGSELAFAIGDVAGKGISAALLMATIQSAMRTQLSATNGAEPLHFSAATLVAQLNKQLYNTTTPEKYATFFFAIYNEALRALTFTNAGHLPPLLVRSGEFTNLNPTGTVVGAFPFAKYEERTVQLEEGDLVVAYTDGIVEPENPYGEMFGESRLKELILRNARAGSSEIISKTMEAVVQWTGSSELQDDMTMIVARRV
ncbi:MAG TPA: SpoIIE family protein phosphatase, partial [Bryobacteraceae bacterium]|nr:SpoIIE family protein phosphatase [Bryobacteraceae bacterium]